MGRETRFKGRSEAAGANRRRRASASKPGAGPHNGHAPRAAQARHGHTAGRLTGRPGQEYRRLLENERRRLLQELEILSRHAVVDPDMPRIGGDGGEDDAAVDAATHALERDRDSAVETSLRSLLDEIDKARARLREGTYGVCDRCGRPISPHRLRAIPYATLCIGCKEDQERVNSPLRAVPFREWRVYKPPKDEDEDEAPEKPQRHRRTV
ncbi:MAG: TraR/DksA C4-type zinc finger protein [Armatimonadota bacterium]|nr:TraR/DksA C4-type zinc finger protein [Armatimonadota bacterium]